MCDVAEISYLTYYRNKDKPDKDDLDVMPIYRVFEKSLGTYGYRRITQALREEMGIVYNKKKVARLMRKYNIVPNYAKKTRRNLLRKKFNENIYPNLVQRHFKPDAPNKVWATDVTQFDKEGEIWYLSTIIDIYDASIVALKYSKRNNLKLVVETLKAARMYRIDATNLIIHSDQGFQYTSYQYGALCRNYGYQISMSRKGTPIDNAVMESFHSRLKTETIYNNDLTTMQEVKQCVFKWLYFYDNERIRKKKKHLKDCDKNSYPKPKYKLDNTIQVAKEFSHLKIPKIKFDL